MIEKLDVQIRELPSQRVLSFTGYGSSPEIEAWQKMIRWAKSHKVLTFPHQQRIFGFNNPDPAPGSPNYGYEFWLTIGPEVEITAGDEVSLKDIPGATYAVLRCESLKVIGERWQQLVQWQQASGYEMAPLQCLEEHLEPLELPDEPQEELLVFDLYLPIRR